MIPSWYVCFFLAAVVAFFAFQRLARPYLGGEDLHWLYICAYCGGYFGARLLSVVIEQPEVRSWQGILLSCFSLGPLTFYGGAIGGSLAALTYALLRRLPLPLVCDVMFPPLFLALGVGRIGCFLNGDDYGKIVALASGQSAPWWAVKFASHGEEVYRYPVQLWESAAGFLLFFIAYRSQGWLQSLKRPGLGGLGCLLCYCLVRFVIEFWRDDPRGWLFFPALSTSQGISASVFVVGGVLLARIIHGGSRPPHFVKELPRV